MNIIVGEYEIKAILITSVLIDYVEFFIYEAKHLIFIM